LRKKEILLELIGYLFEFDAQTQTGEEYSMEDFIGYLNTHYPSQSLELRKIDGEQESWIKTYFNNNQNDISILLVLMYRYAKGYIKKALQESIIQTPDEFSFLITLMTFESLTKTELINKQVIEKTSGTEVIKRLLNQKLIKEFADKEDKRSVRVCITQEGKKEVLALLPQMQVVSKIVIGNLTEAETNSLAYLLKKLDYFHNDIFLKKKNLSLEELRKEIS
jgi:DNA-binding MarR family transcriptional regulator